MPTFPRWQDRSLTSLNISVPRVAHWGSLPFPGGPLLPGPLRTQAPWSEDTEVNTEVLRTPQKYCQPPGGPKLPASSHLSRQLHLENVLITPCSKPWMPWQGIKHPTLLFKEGRKPLIYNVHLIRLRKHPSLLELQSLAQMTTAFLFLKRPICTEMLRGLEMSG